MIQKLTLALLFTSQVIFAQNLPVENLLPAPSAHSFLAGPAADQKPPEFSGPLTDLLDHIFDSLLAQTDFKGYSAAMQLPDGTVWKRAAGLATATGQALNTEHLIGMGSMTKTFIATTLLLLQEEAVLDLDDSIGTWIAPHPNIPGSITVRQLLNHTSGINNYTDNDAWSDSLVSNLDKVWQPEEMLDYVLAPSFNPGTNWEYSNTNYILAGLIIEAVTQKPLHTVLRERLLTPLGLNHTFFYPQETPIGNIAHLWIDLTGDLVPDDYQSFGITLNAIFSSAWAAGALLSTPEDISFFQKKLLNGEIISQASLSQMKSQVPFPAASGYGLALFPVPLCGGAGWGHDGYIFYQSVGFYFPELQMGLVVQSNDSRREANLKVNMVKLYNALAIAYCNYQTTAAAEPEQDLGFMVAPNPVRDALKIQFANEGGLVAWRLCDAFGRQVKSGVVRENGSVGMADLSAGVYWLQLEGIGQRKVIKVY